MPKSTEQRIKDENAAQRLRFAVGNERNLLFGFVGVYDQDGNHIANVTINNPSDPKWPRGNNDLVITVSNPPDARNTKLVVKLDNPGK